MSAMDAPGPPPDHADEMISAPASPPPPPITNDKSANMLEERLVHPAKRLWNTEADEAVESSKRARLSEFVDNKLSENFRNEKLVHAGALSPVQNQEKDTNGNGSGDHLLQDTSNGSLESSSPLANDANDSSLQAAVDGTSDASQKETSEPPMEASPSPKDTSASLMETSATSRETSALNSNNEDESMDMELNSAASSAPQTPKPSDIERTGTCDNGNSSLEDSGKKPVSETLCSEMKSEGPFIEGVESKSKSTPDISQEAADEQSASSGKETDALSEQNVEQNQCEKTPSRTDEDSSVNETTKPDLENPKDQPLTSSAGNVADQEDTINQKSKEVEESSMDCEESSNKKEQGQNAEEDASKRNKDSSRASSPQDDVIVLSDDEMDEAADGDDASSIDTGPFSPLPDDNPLSKLNDEEMDQRDKVIKSLQEELRTEEGKLLLLKKLRQSQLQPVQVAPKEVTTGPTNNTSGNVLAPQKTHPPQNAATSLPQLLRTSQGTKIQLSAHQQQQHLQQLKQLQQLQQQQQKSGGRVIQMPQLVRGSQIQTVGRGVMSTQSGPPPLVMVSRGSGQGQQLHNARHIIRVSGTGTVSTTSMPTAGTQIASINQQSRTSTSAANDSQSAASRQAAAKLALRKQLEKTLLQIPPPKPPPPELHFLPSAANNEFIILVGLEEVVNTILEVEKDSKRKPPQRFTDPFRCAQCKTDFTTIWKQDAKQGIMCETCIVSNQKKSLKAEHTNRLKTAFVKALQQEQEIEQRMQQGQNPIIHSTQQTARQMHQISQIQSQSSQQNRHRVMNPVPHHQRTVLNPAPNTQRVVQPVTYTYIPHMGGVKNSNQAFTYRVPSTQIQMVTKSQIATSHHSAAARQREYLLDMIPSKVLNQNTAVPWKR